VIIFIHKIFQCNKCHYKKRGRGIKKKTFLFPTVLVLLFLGSCSLQKDVSLQQKEIDEAALQAEEKSEEVADLLSGTAARPGDSINEQNMIDQAVTKSDKKEEDAQELLADSQTGGLADYIVGIDRDEAMKCSPGKISWGILEKAKPDEKFYCPCYFENIFNPAYPAKPETSWWNDYTANGYIKKTNEAYVWGLTKCGRNLFFGTAPNVHCLVLQGYLGYTDMFFNESFVCEGNCGDLFTRDWRPPSLYM